MQGIERSRKRHIIEVQGIDRSRRIIEVQGIERSRHIIEVQEIERSRHIIEVQGIERYLTRTRQLGELVQSKHPGLEFDGGTAAICRRAFPTGRNAS